MQSESNRRLYQGPKAPQTVVRPAIRFGTGMVAIACLVLLLSVLWLVRAQKAGQGREPVSDSTAIPDDGLVKREPSPTLQNTNDSGNVPVGLSGAVQVTQPQPTPEARRLVASLIHLDPVGGVLTEQHAAIWKQTLEELIRQGPAGVSAIQEFLAQNTEYNFGPAAKDMLGYGSARSALLDALAQISGPEAINAMTGVLQTTADPREIALLAQNLEKLEPDQHRQEILDAARQTLEMAGAHKLEVSDAAPLFEVLQKFGGSAVVTDLERATSQWNYYGTIALAQLPDNAGIPTLVQLAQDPKTSGGVRDAALQMLAQVSDRSPDARATLLALGQMNQLSLFTWQMVASSLAGDQVGLLNSAFEDHQGLAQMNGLRTVATSDNQNFFALPSALTPEQVNQRMAMIDELLSSTTDPHARELLQQSRIMLRNRLPHSQLTAVLGQ